MMSEIIRDIPFSIDIDSFKNEMMIRTQNDEKRLLEMLRQVKNIASPRAIYGQFYITEKGGDYIVIDNYELKSKILRKNIGDKKRVFLYIITVGKELEQWAGTITGIVESYWADQIQERVLHSAVNYVYKKIDILLGSKISSEMNPGSLPDWPIEEQRKIFALLGREVEFIGLKLTESFLMLPAKSISGIKFTNNNEFENCQLCQRENCPTRRAPYDEKRLEEIINKE